MENECLMSEAIETIVKLLEGTNAKLEGLNSSFMSLHNDLTTFKGDVKASLIDTNGKLKGSHELLSNKIDQLSIDIKRIDKVLGDQIQVNHDEILRNKNTIASLYELDRTATKRNDDAHAELIKGIHAEMNESAMEVESIVKKNTETIIESKLKINIIWGMLTVIATALVYSIIK